MGVYHKKVMYKESFCGEYCRILSGICKKQNQIFQGVLYWQPAQNSVDQTEKRVNGCREKYE